MGKTKKRVGIFLVLYFSILISSCDSKLEIHEELKKTKKEITILETTFKKDSNDYSILINKSKRALEDTLTQFKTLFTNEIGDINLKIDKAKDDYINDISEIKEKYYSRYGHDFKYQEKLNNEMEKAFDKKEKVLKQLNMELNIIQKRIESSTTYIKIKTQEDSLSKKYSEYYTSIKLKYRNQKLKLEQKLTDLAKTLK